MDTLDKIISAKLRGLRAEKGYSLEKVAEKIGMHRETLRKYEANPYLLEVGQLLKLLNIYNVDTIYFFELIYGNLPKDYEIKEE